MTTLSRRRFVQGAGVAGLGLLAACRRLPGQAALGPLLYRVGYLGTEEFLPRLRQALTDLGYIEGQSLALERYTKFVAGPATVEAATELVQVPVDVIVTTGISTTAHARSVTNSIPIVQAGGGGDLVARGLVDTLARPGGNVTGLNELSPRLAAKRLELLREAVPGAARVAVLWNAPNQDHGPELRELRVAAQVLALDLWDQGVQNADELESAIQAAGQQRVARIIILLDSLTVGREPHLAALALKNHLPSIYQARTFADAGGLMSYGPNRTQSAQRAAYYVDRILKGAKPADLPVEQPREFEFVINLQTAQALGLTIPPHVLLQATEVIQ
jgi:putative tryptophan/tyrosine transport system substrate-binding protein